MEQIIEKTVDKWVDKWLESISTGLYVYSIGFGIMLIISGAILLFKKMGSKDKKGIFYGGLVCIIVGIIAIVSGFMQM